MESALLENHSLPYEINTVVGSKLLFYPPIWERNSSGPNNIGEGNESLYYSTKDIPKFGTEQVLTPVLPLRSAGFPNDRPKVKFCDTVTQITLPVSI